MYYSVVIWYYPVLFGIIRYYPVLFGIKSNRSYWTYPSFLYGDVGKMYKQVIQLIDTGIVLDRAEPTKSKLKPENKTTNTC